MFLTVGGTTTSVVPPIFLCGFVQLRRGLYAVHGARRVRPPATMTSDLKPSAPTPLDDATRELIRGKANQIAHRIGLPRTDLPDLEQDLAIHIWTRLDHFDPQRNPDRAAFARMLVAHAAATVFRDQVRRLRHAPASLDALLQAGLPEPLDPRAWPGPEEVSGAALDVPAVLASLSPKLRRVARVLQTHSVTAAARRLKMSRPAVYRRLAELRAALAATGLEEFCPPARTVRARRG
jgi:DNA-directed RNA polymerase specialized sigma24 family protein